jgi:hypothetical protein
VNYVFGLPGNRTLHADPIVVSADVCVDRATRALSVLRRYAEMRYAAKSWAKIASANNRRVVARFEATSLGLDNRFVVTSLKACSADLIYDTLYCARSQAENLIKLHKAQWKSNCTSCRSANANQMRLFLSTVAYWLSWTVRQSLPRTAYASRSPARAPLPPSSAMSPSACAPSAHSRCGHATDRANPRNNARARNRAVPRTTGNCDQRQPQSLKPNRQKQRRASHEYRGLSYNRFRYKRTQASSATFFMRPSAYKGAIRASLICVHPIE